MNLFVTGGSGFLGKHLLDRLARDRHNVWGLARSIKSSQSIEQFGVKPVKGDLNDIEDWESSLKGIDVLVHCASPVEFWGSWEKFDQEINQSTLKLAEAASRNGVKRFVYISSESVLQDEIDLIDIDETQSYPLEPNSYYGKAKKLAEQRLINSKLSMKIIILRPAFIWGVGCPAFENIQAKVKSGQFIWINHGRAHFEAVHVENVVEAIVLSLTNGVDRAVYFVTDGEAATVNTFFMELFKTLRLPIPRMSIPSLIATPLAGLIERIWKFFGIRSSPPLSRFELSFVQMSRRYKIDRANYDLKYFPKKSRVSGFKELANFSNGN